MNIIIISEENHGDIGVATTMKAAFQFLIESSWLEFDFELYDKTTDSWYTLGKVFDAKGIEKNRKNLLAWCLENQNNWEVWDGAFYFHDDTVCEEEDWE